MPKPFAKPACGSGNFLYFALKALRDVEKLASIEHGDALMNQDGSEAAWPEAEAIVGNPPFLGDKMMRGELGDGYVDKLPKLFDGRVSGGADLVTYWFEKARAQIEAGKCQRAGLVATNSIRQKRNRVVLERILQSTGIFEAWSDEDWMNEGAAVRVSIVYFGKGGSAQLDGQPVAAIHADLSGSAYHPALGWELGRGLQRQRIRGRSRLPFSLSVHRGRGQTKANHQ